MAVLAASATSVSLFVEDDAEVREQLAIFLRRRIGRVVVAADGVEGLTTFRQEPTDIVVTDIVMPRMDGLTMTKKIKELDSSVPVVVTTAVGESNYLIRAIEVGVDRYVLKPIDPSGLADVLRQKCGSATPEAPNGIDEPSSRYG